MQNAYKHKRCQEEQSQNVICKKILDILWKCSFGVKMILSQSKKLMWVFLKKRKEKKIIKKEIPNILKRNAYEIFNASLILTSYNVDKFLKHHWYASVRKFHNVQKNTCKR